MIGSEPQTHANTYHTYHTYHSYHIYQIAQTDNSYIPTMPLSLADFPGSCAGRIKGMLY